MCIIYVFPFDGDGDDGDGQDHQICKCINFFVSQPIFFNDPSKVAYCKGACPNEAQFFGGSGLDLFLFKVGVANR